jgi:predicted MFS family arabinose efflux permease
VAAGLPKAAHWHVYLPAVGLSFILMGGLFAAERRGHLLAVWRSAIVLLLLVQLALWAVAPRAPGVWTLGLVLFFFFVAFNVLEASQPSLVSRMAPAHARGAALGVYNTLQSLGLFAGGALGGVLLKNWGAQAVFGATTALAVLWLLLGWAQQVPAAPAAAPH